MKLSKKQIIIPGVIVFIVVAIIALSAAARYLLDSRQTPETQLNELALQTNTQVRKIMGGNQYSVKVIGKECKNQGEGEFFTFGRDTVWCNYEVDVHSEKSGKELRQFIESAGWYRKLYDDGSGADYRNKSAPICTVYDGNTYHSRKEAEETYVDGLFKINCQSFTDHYNSPLPPPPSQ